MKISAGIIVRYKNKYLLCHPTNSAWFGTYSPPKGLLDDNEDIKDGAIREFFEETGILIKKELLKTEPIEIIYNKKKSVYKTAYIFELTINDLSDIGMTSDIIDRNQLQLSEIDWCGFVKRKEAHKRIFWRFEHLIDDKK